MKHDDDLNDIVDGIYEAAIIPQSWPDVLDRISRSVGALGSILFATDTRQVLSWTASEPARGAFAEWLAEGWVGRAERPRRLVKAQHAGFITELDVFDEEELQNDPEHNDFLKPRGFGHSAGTFVPMPTGEVVVYSIETHLGTPPLSRDLIARLDSLRPHLARAGALAVRLGLERARAAAEAFAMIGIAAGALSETGRLVTANELFNRLVPSVFQDRNIRLTLSSSAADQLLAMALTRADDNPDVASIPIPAGDGIPPIVVHLLPVRGQARDVFSRVKWLCIAVPIEPQEIPGAEMLQALFDLTPAEARVARAVAEAKTLDVLAAALGVSVQTVRVQLKSVFAKTGVRRQAELAAMLAGVRIPR